MLGLLAGVGPFAIDMYLPAFPVMAQELGAKVSTVQLSLTAYFAAVALCQVIYGPLSDRIGRKPPLYFGLGLYVLAALGCSLVTSVEALIALRFVQGVGGCAAMVITRAVVRDLYTGPDAARLMATIMLVFSVAPLLAPVTGSALTALGAWRAIFWAIAGIGALSLTLAHFALPETRARAGAEAGGPLAALGVAMRSYAFLLRQPRFLGLVFAGGFAQAGFFAYLGGSSELFVEGYGLSTLGFSAAFAVNAAAFIGGAQLNSPLLRRFGPRRVIVASALGFLVTSGALLGINLAGFDGPLLLCAFLALTFVFLGSLIPSTTVIALDDHGEVAGAASALLGTLRLAAGAVAITLVSQVSDEPSARPLIVTLALCALGSVGLAWLTLRGDSQAPCPGR